MSDHRVIVESTPQAQPQPQRSGGIFNTILMWISLIVGVLLILLFGRLALAEFGLIAPPVEPAQSAAPARPAAGRVCAAGRADCAADR